MLRTRIHPARLAVGLLSATLLVGPITSSPVLGQTLVNGDARWSFSGELNDFEAEPGNDRLLQHLWFWRIEGDPSESEFDVASAPFVVDPLGNVVDHFFSLPSFDAAITTILVDSPQPGNAFAQQGIEVTNSSLTSYTIHLYSYTDFSLGGAENAVFINPGTFWEVTDSATQNKFSTDALGVTAFQVEPFPLLRDLLRDGSPTPLSNTGMPFTGGDFTGAFQWTVSLAPGETRSFFALYFLEGQVVAPPPPEFRRGDANDDGAFDISDAVFSLAAIFIPGSPEVPCAVAADSNDDGAFDISDAVFSLAQLFVPGAPPIPLPGSIDCGSDPTPDSQSCFTPPGC